METKVGISENFLSVQLAEDLKSDLSQFHEEKKMPPAGTGNSHSASGDVSVRSDLIYWLDRKHNNAHENAFFDVMDAFVIYLNNSCYTGITDYEFHYTLYEKGCFYKKHLDQFRTDQSRQYSMITYLNAGWLSGDGGQLSIHHPEGIQQIDPTSGKTVFFKSSELEHEVLITHKPRMSITGWLKK